MSTSISCDHHAQYPAALYCEKCFAILCKMCVDVDPSGFVCGNCKSICRKCSPDEFARLDAARPSRDSAPKSQPFQSTELATFKSKLKNTSNAPIPPVYTETNGTFDINWTEMRRVAKDDSFSRQLNLAGIFMIVYGVLLVFMGGVYLLVVNSDARNKQSSLEINTSIELAKLNARLNAARATSARDSLRREISDVENAGHELDPGIVAAFGQQRMEAGMYMLAGIAMLISFFSLGSYPRGASIAAFAASLTLLPVIVASALWNTSTTTTLIHTASYDIVRERGRFLGMIIALPLMFAIYMMYLGMNAGAALAEFRSTNRK